MHSTVTTRLYTRFSVVFACVMLLAVIVLVFNLALSSSVYAQSSEAEYLRTEAQNARAFADKQRKHAKQWLNRAEQARERAKESKRKRDKESWLDDALRYDKRAELAAIDADKAEAKAAKAEAELVQVLKILKSDPVSNPADTQPEKSASKEDKPEYPEVSLEKTIGAWRIKETDSSLVIVQEEPGSKIHGYKLEAHTADRVWKGIHTPFDEGDIRQMQDARVVFKYKPKAEEMNPEIPEWARKKIEGQLEWQIELDDAGSCSNPALSGYLFPGEVKWSKDTEGGSVKIADRGKPRPIELERVYDFELDMIGRPSLVVIMGGTHDPHLNPIEGLTKRQRFFVKVSLPKKMAEKQGKTLDVTIKGITSEEEDTITLTAGGVRKSKASVNYTHSRPATIADSNDMQEEDRTAKFLSWGWWMDSTDGARLHIDAENAEGIEFRFGDMYETIPIYDSWVQRNIARLESGAWRLRGAFEAIRDSTNPKVKAEHKKNARNSLKMLNNMQTMLDSGYLSDVHKHELLVVYVSHGLVYNVPKGLDDMMKDIMQSSYFIEENRQSLTTGKKMLTGFFEGMTGKDLSSKIPLAIKAVGTNWVADGEKFLARRNLKKASKSIEDQAMDELVPALAYGLYDGVVMTSGAGELYLIGNAIFGSRSRDHTGKKRTGPTDHMGRKRTWTDVVLTSVGLASGTVLGMHGGTAWSRFNDRNIGITIRGEG